MVMSITVKNVFDILLKLLQSIVIIEVIFLNSYCFVQVAHYPAVGHFFVLLLMVGAIEEVVDIAHVKGRETSLS